MLYNSFIWCKISKIPNSLENSKWKVNFKLKYQKLKHITRMDNSSHILVLIQAVSYVEMVDWYRCWISFRFLSQWQYFLAGGEVKICEAIFNYMQMHADNRWNIFEIRLKVDNKANHIPWRSIILVFHDDLSSFVLDYKNTMNIYCFNNLVYLNISFLCAFQRNSLSRYSDHLLIFKII